MPFERVERTPTTLGKCRLGVACHEADLVVCLRADVARLVSAYIRPMVWRGSGRATTLLALGVLVAAEVEAWLATAGQDAGVRLSAALLAAAVSLPLLLVRRMPLVTLLALLTAAALDMRFGVSLGMSWVALLVATHGLGAWAGTRAAVAGALALTSAVLAIDVPRLQEGAAVGDVVPGWIILASVFGLGRWMRARRHDQAALRARTATLERARQEETTAAVAHERARIAHELHDLVGHGLAVIVLQAQAADRTLTTDPDQARRALQAIAGTGRDALTELRRLLDVLATGDDEQIAPTPGLRELDALAAHVRAAGLAVDVRVCGAPRPLSPGLDLSAYRIVQEALTNTLRHAGPAAADVRVRYLPEALEIEVLDDGASGASAGVREGGRVGHGLIGMRERAALYGGTLDTGPRPTGGFAVRAVFPVESS